MFSGSTHLLPTISNYSNARKHWGLTKKPRSGKWADNQRPLKDARSVHYRMESYDADTYIDIVLYGTVMARFYAPDADGNERRLYMGHDSVTSRKFMSDVTYISQGNTEHTTDGALVAAPVYASPFMRDQGNDFSAEFWFTPNGRLLVDRSRHTRHWRRVSVADDKAARAHMRKLWSTYTTLAMFRMPEFIENVELRDDYGQPFSGAQVGWRMNMAIDKIDAALIAGTEPEAEHIDNFFELCQRTFNTLASKRGYVQPGFVMSSWHTKVNLSTYSDLEKPITPQELVKSIERHVAKRLKLHTRSGLVELPQFMPHADYPRSNVLAKENP